MKTLTLIALLLLSTFASAQWDHPAVLCPEKIFPEGHECPDFSRVNDPFTDFPTYMSDAEIRLWKFDRPKDLKLCRYTEALNRENERPGTLTAIQKQIAWMIVEGGKNTKTKLAAIQKAVAKYHMPPHVLMGAITQESLLASLGISPDGGNYSCGVAQLNINEWCEGASRLSWKERQEMAWPQIDCRKLPSNIVSPFYAIAEKRLGDRPSYMITASDFSGIKFESVSSKMNQKQFQAVSSFVNNCQNDTYSIQFKARTLNNLFVNFVPSALKSQSIYNKPTSFGASCKVPFNSKYYPLHTGWLLAVAAYNAGPREVSLVEHYFQVKNNQFPQISPTDLIEALFWGGKVKASNKKVYFVGQNGRLTSQSWYKSCVVQRHVARVIEHVTKPGVTLARSLEKESCSKNVPAYRLNSSGVISKSKGR